jgi:ribonucleoside-diphosphate reductase alpha chain
MKFIPKEEGEGAIAATGTRESMPPGTQAVTAEEAAAPDERQIDLFMMQSDAPMCPECGFIMVRSGACYRCINCGGTSGCS